MRRSFGGDLGGRLLMGDAGAGAYFAPLDPAHVATLLQGEGMIDPALYEENRYDCEDYALAARAIVAYKVRTTFTHRLPPAFGVLIAKVHTLNIGVRADARPYLFDPMRGLVWAEDSMEGALEDVLPSGWLRLEDIRYVFI